MLSRFTERTSVSDPEIGEISEVVKFARAAGLDSHNALTVLGYAQTCFESGLPAVPLVRRAGTGTGSTYAAISAAFVTIRWLARCARLWLAILS